MSLYACAACRVLYSVGAPACPVCGVNAPILAPDGLHLEGGDKVRGDIARLAAAYYGYLTNTTEQEGSTMPKTTVHHGSSYTVYDAPGVEIIESDDEQLQTQMDARRAQRDSAVLVEEQQRQAAIERAEERLTAPGGEAVDSDTGAPTGRDNAGDNVDTAGDANGGDTEHSGDEELQLEELELEQSQEEHGERPAGV